MKWIKKHPYPAVAALFGTLFVVLVIFVAATQFGSSGASPTASNKGEHRISTSGTGISDSSISDSTAEIPFATSKTIPTSPKSGQGGSVAFAPGSELFGFSGRGGERHIPKHQLTVTVTSRAPLGFVGYHIPTSLRDSYGTAKNVGTSWSMTTTVYGSADYARLWAQAGYRGEPVTCTITVDGKVTERRSTQGPYGELFCQG